MKIAYIAHPIGGDVINNLDKVKEIARQINLTEPETVPFAPYFLDCFALHDEIPEERARGIKNDTYLLEFGFVDELRLYGDRISSGMHAEILIALREHIEIVAMTEGTKRDYKALFE